MIVRPTPDLFRCAWVCRVGQSVLRFVLWLSISKSVSRLTRIRNLLPVGVVLDVHTVDLYYECRSGLNIIHSCQKLRPGAVQRTLIHNCLISLSFVVVPIRLFSIFIFTLSVHVGPQCLRIRVPFLVLFIWRLHD
jgi:hypothetical protein